MLTLRGLGDEDDSDGQDQGGRRPLREHLGLCLI